MSTGKKRAAVEAQIPRLAESNYRVTSCKTKRYNCFAWAANDTEHVWSPTMIGAGVLWPPGIPAFASVAGVMRAFESIGYEECDSPDLEVGFEKIAIFTDTSSEPRHAARQLSDGVWTSKLGDHVDIEHDTLDAIGGALYGEPDRYMRRAGVPQPPVEPPRLLRVGGELISWRPVELPTLVAPVDTGLAPESGLERSPEEDHECPGSTARLEQDEPTGD